MLLRWMEEQEQIARVENSLPDRRPEISAEAAEKFRSLGYVE